MNQKISKKLRKLVVDAEKIENLYNAGKNTEAFDKIDDLVDIIDFISSAMTDEPANNFNFEAEEEKYKKSKKYALAVKNNLVLQRKPLDK